MFYHTLQTLHVKNQILMNFRKSTIGVKTSLFQIWVIWVTKIAIKKFGITIAESIIQSTMYFFLTSGLTSLRTLSTHLCWRMLNVKLITPFTPSSCFSTSILESCTMIKRKTIINPRSFNQNSAPALFPSCMGGEKVVWYPLLAMHDHSLYISLIL